METTVDLDDLSWVHAAADDHFATLLRDLFMEHERVKWERAELLAKLEKGLAKDIQLPEQCSPSQRSEGSEDVSLNLIKLEGPDLTRKQSEESQSPLNAIKLEGPPGKSKQSEESQFPSDQTRSVHFSHTPSSSVISIAHSIDLHYLWEKSPESIEGLRSKSTTKGISFKVSSDTARGGDVLVETGLMQRLIMSPNDCKRMFWDLLSIMALGYDIVMVPMLAFDFAEAPWLQIINLGISIFWTCDIFASCLTGFYVEGRIEMRPLPVMKNYLRGWFLFDAVVVLIDWCLLAFASGVAEVVGLFRMSKLLRLGRILRALRLVRLLRLFKMPAIMEEFADYARTDSLVVAFQVLRALCTIAVANHFLACGWYAVGKVSTPSWITQLDDDGRDLAFRYATSLHWSLTQFTPAGMEIHPKGLPERVYSICVLFLALVVFSSFVSSITNAMNHLRQSNAAASKQKSNLRRYMQENRLSLDLSNRINAFARHLRVRTRMRVHEYEIDVFKVLPEMMRWQLHWEIYVPVLSSHPLFFHCVDFFEEFMMDICNSTLQEKSLLTGQELFRHNAEATAMYFVDSGSLEYYLGRTDIPIAEVSADEACCEVALWLRWTHEGQLVALTPSELVTLDASIFRKLVSHSIPVFGAFKIYAVEFYERVLSLTDCHPDLFHDHDASLEMAHQAFEPVRSEREHLMPDHPSHTKSWRSWHSWSFMQHTPPFKLGARSMTH